ncbi:tellurite resistance/C4-dicarboxylate transporter family protein [Arachidicoccus terrestris]|uniref:tellurite resistance/C4-dicarboxylate transporter family protein n=1 Tax=Arachidicoccus terrestris TaxID=2875539 RepID=UPI001CC6A840|nr:tellurite resistance/C4-dicarboxylate transporter family protein [Arachidicoccus terrestris]UAY55433.1 tellurite resistance/C4-dicarboxylate transporter family protein [Arachidicoccus terrestris]
MKQSSNNIWTRAEHYFSPIDFAMVMATGILSIAALLEGYTWLAWLLYYTDVFLFIVLFIFMLRRLLVEWPLFIKDFMSYEKGPGVFTFIIAMCMIGNQVILFNSWQTLGQVILTVAVMTWIIVNYGFFFFVTTTNRKKSLKDGISGSWLLSVVSIQAIAVLIIYCSNQSETGLFIATCLFFTGSVFYLYLMSLIIYRISFFELHARDLGAAYWINMGATAITALAGSLLLLNGHEFHLIVALTPFIKGLTLLFWSAGTWWIPLLILLGIWRHVIRKVKTPITASGYSPTYWAFVFPLGMYTASTYRLSETLDLAFLKIIPDYFIFIAMATWCAVMTGLIRHLLEKNKINGAIS